MREHGVRSVRHTVRRRAVRSGDRDAFEELVNAPEHALPLATENHPNRPLADLRRIGWGSLRHGSILSRVRASGKPGAVQWSGLVSFGLRRMDPVSATLSVRSVDPVGFPAHHRSMQKHEGRDPGNDNRAKRTTTWWLMLVIFGPAGLDRGAARPAVVLSRSAPVGLLGHQLK